MTGLNKALDDGFVYALLVGPLSRDFGGERGVNYDVCSDSYCLKVWSGPVFGSLRGWTETETGLPLF